MDNSIIFTLFALIFISIISIFIYLKRNQDYNIKVFLKDYRKSLDGKLELLTTFDLIKELKKRQNPPIFIGWIDKDENNRINYFIFKKNLEKKTSLIILQRMIEDIKKYS